MERSPPYNRARTGPRPARPAYYSSASLLRPRQLAPQACDVVLVQLDLLLVGLEALDHFLIVALAPQAHGILACQLLPRLVEQPLFAGELLIQYPAAVRVALALGIRVDLGKRGGRGRCSRAALRRRRLRRGHRVGGRDIQQLAALGLGLDVGK